MILTAQDLSVSFGRRLILEGFSLELAQGDHCALTGRSGSGKTTLLLLLAGLLTPTSGTIERHVESRDVIYVPQAPSLVPELSALQNASLGLRIRGIDPAQAEDSGRQQLQALGLSDVDDALPAELSGGMQQRVALARALAIGARLLLVDEPTGALDRATGEAVIEVLKASGSTVIVATHDPDVAGGFPRRLVIDKELVR